MVRCPAHHDRDPSLSIQDAADGKVLVCCHAGCDQWRVIAALRSRGLWEEGIQLRFTGHSPAAANDRPPRDDAKRSEVALAVWNSATSAVATMVETYLVSRGLHITPPPTLRFHARLKHPSGGFWPAMVALVTRGADDAPVAIHRTFLARDGGGKAPVQPQKMMLGPCRGGAVRLAPVAGVMMVGEGIETCFSAMQATGGPAWAALSTSGLRTLGLPAGVREVILVADGDTAGEAAARDCGWRWKREGRRVRIARPPQGTDFNDLLMGRPRHQEVSAMSGTDKPDEPENLIAAAIGTAKDIRDPLDGLVERTATDPGALFAPDALECLSALKKTDRAAFVALRMRLKSAGCRLMALDEAIAGEKGATGGAA
jgi:hypothetical protein